MSNKNASCDTIAWDVSGVAKQLYGSWKCHLSHLSSAAFGMTLVHPCWTHTAIMDRQALESATSRQQSFSFWKKKIKSHCCHTCHACHACQQLKTCQRFPMSNKNASCDTIAWDVSGVAKQLYGSWKCHLSHLSSAAFGMTLVHPCWTHTAIMDRQALESATSRQQSFSFWKKKIKSHCCHTCHACHALQQLKTCQRFPMSNKNASCDTIAWDVSGVSKQLFGSWKCHLSHLSSAAFGMTLVHPCWTHTAIMDRQALESATSRQQSFSFWKKR